MVIVGRSLSVWLPRKHTGDNTKVVILKLLKDESLMKYGGNCKIKAETVVLLK